MSSNSEDQELLEGFLSEATELLEKIDDDLIILEQSPGDMELLNRIFRSIHTVKGAASFLEFDQLVKVTHKTEDVLNRLRKSELVITSQIMDVILESVDLVKLLINDIKNDDIKEQPIDGIIAKLVTILESNSSSDNSDVLKAVEPIAIDASQNDLTENISTGKTAKIKKNSKSQSSTAKRSKKAVVEIDPAPPQSEQEISETPVKVEPTTPVRNEPPQVAPGNNRSSGEELTDKTTVRVDVKRVDDLMNQVGELVLERNRMMQLTSDYLNETNMALFGDELAKLSKRMSFVTSELQMQVLKMRLIPVGNVFKKFPRIVRNLARDLGKKVDLSVFGEETELDRSVVDEIGDPLIHLLRNAMDHGLETPAERKAAGKSETGSLVLAAKHEGNQIIISIKDDGRGIDCDRVATKALEKGLVTQEQLSTFGQRDIFDLLFLPGFSTKDAASDLSGRGVGMDVVRTNIKKLNGIIDIKSEPGRGSEFILKLPLTLAIIQSLLVEVEGETYSIPLSSVLETLRVQEENFHMIGGRKVLKLKDSVLPLLELANQFNVSRSDSNKEYCYVVVVGVAEKRLGLVVSKLLGQQEVAIKSLGNYLANVPGIAGSTIMGDGKVALIIDPSKLLDLGMD